MLRLQNKAANRLGVPLPQGSVALFEEQAGRPLLVGEASIRDKAVDEEVELGFSGSPAVRWSLVRVREEDGYTDVRLTVTNANPRAVRFELRLGLDEGEDLKRPSARLSRKEGNWLWTPTVPANGNATLTYRIVQPPE
jgi:hypothetical protein